MLKDTLDTVRALLLGLLVAVVFFAGLTTGTRLGRTPSTHANTPPTPDLAATISALEARIEELVQEAPGGATRASTPTSPRPPTPTLRVVTRATIVGTWGSVEKDRAVEIAREYVGGGEVIAVTQEKKYGTVVVEVEFRYGSEVYVDVQSGRVLYAEVSPADRQTGANVTSTPTPVPMSTPTLVPPTATPLPTATPTPEPVPLATGDGDERDDVRDEEAQQQPSTEEAKEDEQAVSPPAPQEHDEDDSPHQDESRSNNDDRDDRDDDKDDDKKDEKDKDDDDKDDDDDNEHEDDD